MNILVLLVLLSSNVRATSISEWKFNKSIEISSKKLLVDGKAISGFKCPFKKHTDKKEVLGIFSSKDFSLTVTCLDNYMGGFFVNESNLILAQKDGDAGQIWDKQSILFRDSKSSKYILWRTDYFIDDTSVECDLMVPANKAKYKECLKKSQLLCSNSETFYQWDKNSRRFKSTEYSGKKPQRLLSSKLAVLSSCKK